MHLLYLACQKYVFGCLRGFTVDLDNFLFVHIDDILRKAALQVIASSLDDKQIQQLGSEKSLEV